MVFINVLVMIVLLSILYYQQKKFVSFSKRVFTGIGLGVVFGVVLQIVFEPSNPVIGESIQWFNIISKGYVRFLQMIIMPLIFVSITSAITNLKDTKSLGKFGGFIVIILTITTGISAIIGVGTSVAFNLTATSVSQGQKEEDRALYLEGRADDANTHIGQKIYEVIPTNPFNAFAGNGSNATLSVVLFSVFVGIATIGSRKKHPEEAKLFASIIQSLHVVVMRMVTLILRLTPYGVMALMTSTIAESNFAEIINLGKFVIASYTALFLIILMHLIILSVFGLSPTVYLKKIWPLLTFSFISRSSAAAIPMSITTQREKFGISESVASLSASFGASIGQNGCAGMYPAMLAVMIAPTVGINPLDIAFIIKLVVIVAISSFGVAGVGGGATFAALIVLSAMGLPVGLAGVLISIEPLIDMGRTAANVSGSVTASILTAKFTKEIDNSVYNDMNIAVEEML
jgi:uncharacterized protein